MKSTNSVAIFFSALSVVAGTTLASAHLLDVEDEAYLEKPEKSGDSSFAEPASAG